MIAHFGLGKNTTVDSVIVNWTGGKEQILLSPVVDSLITVVEKPDEKGNIIFLGALITAVLALLGFIYFLKIKPAKIRK